MHGENTKQKTTVVSAKVLELKRKLERAGVDVSSAIRKGLEDSLKQKKIAELEKMLQGVSFDKLSDEQIVRDIRTSRDRNSRKN